MSQTIRPFTPQDLLDWQADLYPQPDPVVDAAADAASANFKKWLTGCFEFSEDQMEFIDSIDASVLEHWANSVSYYIRHRLPIELDKPSNAEQGQRSRKLVTSKDRASSQTSSETREEAYGALLTFTISY